jgi:hypothetical protein
MSRWLFIGSLPPFLAGLSLFIGIQPWAIQPPIMAAFFLAAYWAGFFLMFLSSRQRAWAQSRLAIPAVMVFTVLEAIATFQHIDRFHLNSSNLLEGIVAWGWLVPYVAGPLVTAVLVARQLKAPGADPTRRAPLPTAMRWALGLQAVIMIVLGAALFVAPEAAGRLWPWTLTPLTGKIVGAWLVGLGVGTAHVMWENDFGRILAGSVSYTFFGAFLLVVLARYAQDLNWSGPSVWLYALFLLSLLVVGAYGWRGARRAGAA